MPSSRSPGRITETAALLLLCIPCLAYLYVCWFYPLDIPFIDDFGSLLERINTAAEATSPSQWMAAMFAPNAGHTPFLTRLILLLEGLFLGGINFHYSLVAGNAGILLTAIALMAYGRSRYRASVLQLAPIPFLLLSITYWEQLDFLTPAWQMAWGSMLLPVAIFLAILHRKPLWAGLAFACAVYFSAGAYVLYPLAAACCLRERDWRSLALFSGAALLLLLPLGFYSLFSDRVEERSINIATAALYFLTFMGNILSTGSYDLRPYADLHQLVGLAVLCAGGYACYRFRQRDLEKLLFFYVILLGLTAAIVRGTLIEYVPPRYSQFALLGVTALYLMFMSQPAPSRFAGNGFAAIVLLLSTGVWAHSYLQCLPLLEINKSTRYAAVQKYLGGDRAALEPIIFRLDFGEGELARAKGNGFYDIEVMRSFQNASMMPTP